MKYVTHVDGKMFTVNDIGHVCKNIQILFEDAQARNKYLEEENKKLKDEAYKDNEIQKMKARLEKVEKDYWRGFPISESEQKAIEKWKRKHEKEKHGITTLEGRLAKGGCIGGDYSYHFIPTSIGIIGTVKCSCGEEFNFQEL